MLIHFIEILFGRPNSTIVVDLTDKKILYAKSIHKPCFPASLTKKMTLYMLFESLKKGKITLNTKFNVSKRAVVLPPTKLGLKVNQKIRVKDIIMALIVQSANDVAVVAAEGLGNGSVENFVCQMNAKAQKLGMKHTIFRNPHGLHHNYQITTAYDMARLGHALHKNFPEYFGLFKTKSFSFEGQTYSNHNKILNKNSAEIGIKINGIKTGYTSKAGYNITTTALRHDKNGNPHMLLAVVMGENTSHARNRKALMLLQCVPLESRKRVQTVNF